MRPWPTSLLLSESSTSRRILRLIHTLRPERQSPYYMALDCGEPGRLGAPRAASAARGKRLIVIVCGGFIVTTGRRSWPVLSAGQIRLWPVCEMQPWTGEGARRRRRSRRKVAVLDEQEHGRGRVSDGKCSTRTRPVEHFCLCSSAALPSRHERAGRDGAGGVQEVSLARLGGQRDLR